MKIVAFEFGRWAASNGGLVQDRFDVLLTAVLTFASRSRSVSLLDLAAAHAVTDAEHGMDFAAQAFDQLEREPYGNAYGRIPAVRRALEGTPQARMLDEGVRSWPAVG